MIPSVHIVVGALLGEKVKDIFWVIPLSFISHFILDAIPHREVNLPKNINFKNLNHVLFVVLDFILGFSLVLLMIKNKNYDIIPLVGIGIFFSLLPDILQNIPLIGMKTNFLNPFRKFHEKIQSENISNLTAFFIQAGILILVLILSKFI